MSIEGFNLGMAIADYNARNNEKNLYTLAEAERELQRRECTMQGHYYDVEVRMGENRPAFVLCSRCGERWEMSPTGRTEISS